MPIEIRMPALSPTMEEGTLARWLVKPGDRIESGDVMAEIETDKATMEFEAVDEGTLAAIVVDEGSENVKVGTVIALLAEEGEDVEEVAKSAASLGSAAPAAPKADERQADEGQADEGKAPSTPGKSAGTAPARASTQAEPAAPDPRKSGRIIASPLARRLAEQHGLDLAAIKGSGPNGRIIKADIEAALEKAAASESAAASASSAASAAARAATAGTELDAPFEEVKLNNVRKVIARRLTEAKQQIPHIYLTLDVRLDALLKLRKELNASLEPDGVKLSVNDLLIKALARALQRVPKCNVSFQGDHLRQYHRQDISVAVAAPTGLITPIIRDAANKGLAQISREMKELASKAREGKLQPQEYQGGTASLSNLGMFGIKQFDAVINPPQAMILAVGAGEQRPHVVEGALQVATVMSATGSFDHRAIDGADGAQLMQAFQHLVENPLSLVA